MEKSGTRKPVLILALIGMMIIGLVQPIAATCQDRMMEQEDKTAYYPDNESMMQSEMREDAPDKMCETPSKEKMMDSMMMEEKSCNETMMNSMIACAHPCLEKAIKLHEMHMKNPEAATNESKMEMMYQMMLANKYLTGEKMAMDVMDRAADNKSVGYERPYVISAQTRLDCSCFWLDEAIKLNKMHMMEPEKATDESRMRLMAHMMRANRYLAGEGMHMEMDKNVSFFQDNVNITTLWLEKAMKLHYMHMKNPELVTNESRMRLFNQMMWAHECAAGKKMDMEMLMDFDEDSAREMYETAPRERMMGPMMMAHMRMGEKSLNETMMHSMMNMMMEERAAKKDKMDCMMKEKLANESCYRGKMEQKVNLTQANMDCIYLRLNKAIKIHEMCLGNPEADTSESKMEMMKHMIQAHEYLTGEKMDMEMMKETGKDKFAEWLNNETADEESAEWINAAVDSEYDKCKDTAAKSESSGC